jgi:hypothetical protein
MLGDLRDEHGDLGEYNEYFKVDLTPKTRSSIWITPLVYVWKTYVYD